MAKKKKEKTDGLGPTEKAKIRIAVRKVWHWSQARRLAVKRAERPNDFFQCEKCKDTVPKVYIDHKVPVGIVDSGFIERLFCPSKGLQALCKNCHRLKTNKERTLKTKGWKL